MSGFIDSFGKTSEREEKLYKHLQTKDKRGIIAERKSIEDRPEIVEKRCRIGNYEADWVLGKNHKKAILTMNDRATGYTFWSY